MTFPATEYPDSLHQTHIHLILAYMLTHGSISHDEAEKHCQKCTVIRSRIPDIKYKLHWPVISKPEPNEGHRGSHARYFLDFQALADEARVAMDSIKKAAREWASSKDFSPESHNEFVLFAAKKYRRVEERQAYLFEGPWSKPEMSAGNGVAR